MAAQTAKQVIIQKLREAERVTIFDEYKEQVGEIVTGVIQRREPRMVLIDLGKAIGILPEAEQIPGEHYRSGDRIKVFILRVEMGSKGPDIILSRAHADMVKKLFELEIPEISSGVIEVKSVAREAGSRTKIAVKALMDNIDPIGSCVGQRGTRVQTIINEIGGEKLDIIEYNDDPAEYITNSLSPAKIVAIEIDEKTHSALVTVEEDQLSLAIGKSGQNVRLAVKLTGWKINIKSTKSDKIIASGHEGENLKHEENYEEAKGEEAKGEEAKGEEAKGEEAKGEEIKEEEAKEEEAKEEEAKGEEAKGEEIKEEEAKGEEVKEEEAKGEEIKEEEAKGEEIKEEEAKEEEAKGEEAKGEEAKGEEAKGEEAKGEEAKGENK
jgi:N utilization substance protein A